MTLLKLSAATALLACTGLAQAQSTLGELLDRGAQKLTPAEARAQAPLTVMRDTIDADARITLRPDGTVVGKVENKQGHGSSEARGTWTVDASGKRCLDVNMPNFRMQWNECNYPYRLGTQVFSVPSDTDRDARATAYVLTAYVRQ